MKQLMELFISESRELLEVASKALLALERNPDDNESLNKVFRSTHTLKSSSAMFDYDAMTELMHTAEDLLDKIRRAELAINSSMVDQLLESLDLVVQWIDYVEANESFPNNAASAAKGLLNGLKALTSDSLQPDADTLTAKADEKPSKKTSLDKTTLADTTKHSSFLTESLVFLRNDQRRTLFRSLLANNASVDKSMLLLCYTPEPRCFFDDQDPFELMRQLPDLQLLHIEPTAPWEDLDEIDPYHCQLRFIALSSAEPVIVEQYLTSERLQPEYDSYSPLELIYVDEGEAGPAPELAQTLLSKLEAEGIKGLTEEAVKQLMEPEHSAWQGLMLSWLMTLAASPLASPETLKKLLDALANGHEPRWFEQSTAAKSEESVAVAADDDVAKDEFAVVMMDTDENWQAFKQLIKLQMQLLELPSEPALWHGIINSVARTACNALIYIQRHSQTELINSALQQSVSDHNAKPLIAALKDLLDSAGVADESKDEDVISDTFSGQDEGGEKAAVSRTLKVDQGRIDQFMDLIGELIVAKNGLPYLAKRAEQVFNCRELAKEIKEQHSAINHISEALQGLIMQVRMMPVSLIFQRLPRVVRDLAHQLDKKVDLVVEGEETEADKNVIELLLEPLIHLVRNSIGHGIESTAIRREQGKNEVGQIRIRAWQESDSVCLEVSDDGQGIDPEKVRQRISKMGLLAAEKINQLTDHEIIQYCFMAGLSTDAKVSGLSGRGVGMDVVHSTVEQLGGTVTLHSEVGQGTQAVLSLPLSAAVSRIMTFEVSGQNFGLPIDCVVETMRLPLEQVQHIKQSATFLWRDQTVPLIFLNQLLQFDQNKQKQDNKVAVLVIKHLGEYTGLVVSDFHGGMDLIIKPMAGVMVDIPGYTGTALLGDGSVLLVLNLRELL